MLREVARRCITLAPLRAGLLLTCTGRSSDASRMTSIKRTIVIAFVFLLALTMPVFADEVIIPLVARDQTWANKQLFSEVPLGEVTLLDQGWDRTIPYSAIRPWSFVPGTDEIAAAIDELSGYDLTKSFDVRLSLSSEGSVYSKIDAGRLREVVADVEYPLTGLFAWSVPSSQNPRNIQLRFDCNSTAGQSLSTHDCVIDQRALTVGMGLEAEATANVHYAIGSTGPMSIPLPSLPYQEVRIAITGDMFDVWAGVTGGFFDVAFPGETYPLSERDADEQGRILLPTEESRYVEITVDIDSLLLDQWKKHSKSRLVKHLPSGLGYEQDFKFFSFGAELADAKIGPFLKAARSFMFTPRVGVRYRFNPRVFVSGNPQLVEEITIWGDDALSGLTALRIPNGVPSVSVTPTIVADHELSCTVSLSAGVGPNLRVLTAGVEVGGVLVWPYKPLFEIDIPYPCGPVYCPICKWCDETIELAIPEFWIPGWSTSFDPIWSYSPSIDLPLDSHRSTQRLQSETQLEPFTIFPGDPLSVGVRLSTPEEGGRTEAGILFVKAGDVIEVEINVPESEQLPEVLVELGTTDLDEPLVWEDAGPGKHSKQILVPSRWPDGAIRAATTTSNSESQIIGGNVIIVDNSAPGSPVTLWPEDGAVISESEPTLGWSEALDNESGSGVAFYKIEVRYADSETPFIEESCTSAQYVISRLAHGQTHNVLWRVRAIDKLGIAGEWSAENDLRVDLSPPNDVQRVSPAHESYLDASGGVRLSWEAATDDTGIDSYRITRWISTCVGCPWEKLPVIETESLSIVIPETSLEGEDFVLYWTVEAIDEGGNVSNRGTPWHFIGRADSLDKSYLGIGINPTSPVADSRLSSSDVELAWSLDARASDDDRTIQLTVEIYGDKPYRYAFPEQYRIWGNGTSDAPTSYTIPEDILPENGEVQWRINGTITSQGTDWLGQNYESVDEIYSPMSSFMMDRRRPRVESVAVSFTRTSSVKGILTAQFEYDEQMDKNSRPTLSCIRRRSWGATEPLLEEENESFWVLGTTSHWNATGTVFSARFPVSVSASSPTPSFTLSFIAEGARDLAGNYQFDSYKQVSDGGGGAPPERVTGFNPSDGMIISTSEPTLCWAPAEDTAASGGGQGSGVARYQLQYRCEARETSEILSESVSVEGTEFTLPALDSGNTYDIYWRVIAVDRFGQWGPWSHAESEMSHLIVDTTPPSIASLASPRDLTSVRSVSSMTLRWSPSTDNVGIKEYIVSIRIFVGNEKTPETLTYRVSSTAFDLPDNLIEGNGSIRWSVCAVDKAGNIGERSAVRDLIVAGEDESPLAKMVANFEPHLVSPSDGTVFDHHILQSPNFITLKWNSGWSDSIGELVDLGSCYGTEALDDLTNCNCYRNKVPAKLVRHTLLVKGNYTESFSLPEWYVQGDVSESILFRLPRDIVPTNGTVSWQVKAEFTPFDLPDCTPIYELFPMLASFNAYSETYEFTVDVAPPSPPIPVSPLGGVRTSQGGIELAWNPSADAGTGVAAYYVAVYLPDQTSVTEQVYSGTTYTIPESDAATNGQVTWRVYAMDGAGNRSNETGATFLLDSDPPEIATLLSPEDGAFAQGQEPITLTWNAADDMGGHGGWTGVPRYQIQFAHDGVTHEELCQGTSYVVPAEWLPQDGTAHWKVRAIDSAGNTGEWSDTWSIFIDSTPPTQVFLLSPTDGGFIQQSDEIHLVWNASNDWDGVTNGSGVVGYQVTVSGAYDELLESDSTSIVLPQDIILPFTPMAWSVQPIDAVGNHGAVSDTWRFSIAHAPQYVQASDGTAYGYVEITWDPADGATWYTVWRSDSENGDYIHLEDANIGADESLEWLDTTAVPARTYWYKVKSRRGDFHSELSTANSGYLKPLAAPANVQATDGTLFDSIEISWDASNGAGWYQVYRGVSEGGPFQPAEGGSVSASDPLSWQDTSAEYDTVYWYKVQPRNSEQFGYIGEQAPDSGYCALPAPSNVQATDGESYGHVEITWDTADGATWYNVWRSDSENGDYIHLEGANIDANDPLTWLDTTAVPARTYWYKVKSRCGDFHSELSTANSGYLKPLAAPANVQATNGTLFDQIEVTWDASDGAEWYKVYRGTSETGPFLAIDEASVAAGDPLVWHDTTADYDTVYWYKIQPRNSEQFGYVGDQSPASGYRTLPAPTNVQASDGSEYGHVVITWDAANGATWYNVWRSDSELGDYIHLEGANIGADEPLTWLDTTAVPAKTYWYKVKSRCGDFHSELSTADSGHLKPLAAPANVQASDGSEYAHVVITWDAADGATWYNVWRSDSEDGTFVHLEGADIGANEALTWLDTTAFPAKTYWYKVKSRCGDFHSELSTADSGHLKPLAAPANVQATDGTLFDSIEVSWDASDGAGWYQVYRGVSEQGPFLSAEGSSTSASDPLTWKDTSAEYDTVYWYKVQPRNSEQQGSVRDQSPDSGYLRQIEAPTNIQASDSTSFDGVEITWSSVEGATWYNVWRSNTQGGTYSHVEDANIGADDPLTWLDKTAEPTTTYWYKVKSRRGDFHSELSTADSGSRRALLHPENIQASDATDFDTIEISWDSSAGAEWYQVYRGVSEGGPFYPADGGSVTATVWQDTSADYGTVYWYKVQPRRPGQFGSVRDQDPDSGYLAQLEAPQNVQATNNTTSDHIRVTWSSAEDASSYEVYRATSSSGSYSLVGSSSSTTYDDDAEYGREYWYKVRSQRGSYESDLSSSDSGVRRLLPPDDVEASDGTSTDYVEITWDLVEDASWYKIHRGTSASGSTSQLAVIDSATQHSYHDTTAEQGFTYWYKVEPRRGGFAGDYSDPDSGFAELDVPDDVEASDNTSTDHVEIEWDKVDDATWYQVYRATSSSGSYSLVGNIDGAYDSYEDDDAEHGRPYYYKVRARRGDFASELSSPDEGVRSLDTPDDVEASDNTSTDHVEIEWDKVDDATWYQVYRATSSSGSYSKIADVSGSNDSYEDDDAEHGLPYYYKVRARRGDYASELSSPDDGVRSLLAPDDVEASDNTSTEYVEITWDKADDATWYQVYRATSSSGSYSRIADVGGAYDSYEDDTAEPGVTYWYKVRSRRGNYASELSSSDAGTCSP